MELSQEALLEAQKYARPIAIRILGLEAAEDALQNAALAAIRKFSSFRGDSAFNTWFMRIAINHCLMYRRQFKNDRLNVPLEEISGEAPVEFASSDPSPFELAAYHELHDFVLREIALMPPYVRKGAGRILTGEPAGGRTERARTHRCRTWLKNAIVRTNRRGRLGKTQQDMAW